MKIKIYNTHWNDSFGIKDGLYDKICHTSSNTELLKNKIKYNIHYIRWIIQPSTHLIDYAYSFKKRFSGYIHPFLWQDELEYWIVKKICIDNWKAFKYVINPPYKLKKEYYNLLLNKKFLKNNNIDVFLYELYKPSWDEKEQKIKNKINSRR